jgi:two-component system, NarL family, sensor kinase
LDLYSHGAEEIRKIVSQIFNIQLASRLITGTLVLCRDKAIFTFPLKEKIGIIKIVNTMNQKLSPETETEQLQRRNRELSILNSIAQALNSSVDLQQALNAVLAQMAELFDLQAGWVWLLDEQTGAPYIAARQSLPPGLIQNPELMEGTCYCLDTFMAGDLNGAANVNVITCSRLKKLAAGDSGLRYHASIPLYAQGKQLGVFNVASPDWRELSAEDLRILYTVGNLLGIAIERARLYNHSAEYGATEERNRLAREIHDTLAQGLTGISLILETTDELLVSRSDPNLVRQKLHQALSLVRTNLDEARRSVMDLRAAPLEGRNLVRALEDLTSSITTLGQVEVYFEKIGAFFPLPGRIETGLYRIAQEALSNVEKHSKARQAWMRITLQPDQVMMVIEDNGKGFDPVRTEPGHFGMIGLAERARLLGGSLTLETDPSEGTRIVVVVPIH